METPELETLGAHPSWCMLSVGEDRPTRVDRSACLEVKVAEVRRLALCVAINRRTGKRDKRAGVAPLPGERASWTQSGRRATGVFEISGRMLEWLAGRRPARQLAGDFRGTRSNAMRPVGWQPGDGPVPGMELDPVKQTRKGLLGHRMRNSFGAAAKACGGLSRGEVADRVLLENVLPGNPNRRGPFDLASLDAWEQERERVARGGGGMSERKVLALGEGWSQPLRLERWQLTPGRPPFYYLVCPGCGRGPGERIERAWEDDPRVPGLSRLGRGKNAWTSLREGGCPQRVIKLYLPMATPAEARDAQIAWVWYRSLPLRLKTTPEAKRVLARYGALFAPRALMCRYCLKLGYGSHPEHARQGMRRRAARASGRMS